MLVDAVLVEDPSKIWWDVRPHGIFPALEMRIAKIYTRMEDGITIAAIYASLLAMLTRLRHGNQRWRVHSNMLVRENRWLAERYGYGDGLVNFGCGERVPYADLLEEIIALVCADAQMVGCLVEVSRARDMVANRTSAHHQVAISEKAKLDGAEERVGLVTAVN